MVYKKKGYKSKTAHVVETPDVIDEETRYDHNETSETDLDLVKKSKSYYITMAIEKVGELTSFQYDQQMFQKRTSEFVSAFSKAFYATIADVKEEDLKQQIHLFVLNPSSFVIREMTNKNKVYAAPVEKINLQPMLDLFFQYMQAMTKEGLYSTIERTTTETIVDDYSDEKTANETIRLLRDSDGIPPSEPVQSK